MGNTMTVSPIIQDHLFSYIKALELSSLIDKKVRHTILSLTKSFVFSRDNENLSYKCL